MARLNRQSVWKRYDRPSNAARNVILTVFALFLALPIVGMLYFTFRSAMGGFTLDHWLDLFAGESSSSWTALEGGLVNSIVLVLVTIAIEYVIVIPALVLIDVRFAPIFSVLSNLFSADVWTLALAYGIIALPFVYTTIEADLSGMNAATLAQAAESLGAGWWRILVSIMLPCLRRSIVSATLITSAIVLGEFTIASLLNRETLQTDLIVISKSDVYVSVIITLIVLVLTFIALFLVSGAGKNHKERKQS